MKNITNYRILKKALEIIELKTKEEIQSMLQLVAAGRVEDVIIEEVTSQYNVKIEDLKKPNRRREYLDPRQIIMYFLRTKTNLTFKTIGEMMGGKDHATVIHAVKCVENNMFFDDYRKIVEKIEKNINIALNE